MIFEKVESVCPQCGRINKFEIACVEKGCTLTSVTCKSCGKNYHVNPTATKLAKSAPSSYGAELNQLRAQLREQFEELTKRINGILAQREAAARKFRPDGVEKADTADQALRKALSNGKPVGAALEEADTASPRFQPAVSTGTFERQRGGTELHAEKTDAADAELKRAFASPVPVGGRFTPRG